MHLEFAFLRCGEEYVLHQAQAVPCSRTCRASVRLGVIRPLSRNTAHSRGDVVSRRVPGPNVVNGSYSEGHQRDIH
jgi:hypothetical protein